MRARTAWMLLAIAVAAPLSAASGCNKLLGDFAGPGGAGGSAASSTSSSSSSTSGTTTTGTTTTGTTGSGGTGGTCGMYDGMGSVTVTDAPTANLPSITFGFNASISATHYKDQGYTELSMSGPADSQFCDLAALLDLSGGLPVMGMYNVVDQSPYASPTFGQTPKDAYLFVTATPTLDGGCNHETQAFGSTLGSGTVQITSVEGKKVKFTVTSVKASGISDSTCAGMGVSTCDGTGTIQVSIQGEADCLSMP
jgi:hypothetical protein